MIATCSKRLRKEIQANEKCKDDEIDLEVNNENILEWKARIKAPPDSVYEGFFFDIRIAVPQEYPLVPPKMWFLTPIFHPNVHFESGEICLDILKKEWSPVRF